MVDVFISYPRSVASKALRIRKALHYQSFTTFFDIDSIRGGRDYPDIIDSELKAARVVLACWSKDAFASEWCKSECRIGRARDVLVPVAVAPLGILDMHVEFSGVHYYDLSSWEGESQHDGWKRTLAQIYDLVGRSAPIHSAHPPTKRQNNSGLVLVPVAKDGTAFTPTLRTRHGFTIGPKGNEQVVSSFDDALRLLEHRAFNWMHIRRL
jgi:hypothetical protein